MLRAEDDWHKYMNAEKWRDLMIIIRLQNVWVSRTWFVMMSISRKLANVLQELNWIESWMRKFDVSSCEYTE